MSIGSVFQKLPRFGLAVWLGVVALAAGGLEQNQLAINVVDAAIAGGPAVAGHIMPDGRFMAGPMVNHPDGAAHGQAADAGGHTNKGHADCEMCGAVAAMSAVAAASGPVVPVPWAFAAAPSRAAPNLIFPGASRAPYASRAPPALI